MKSFKDYVKELNERRESLLVKARYSRHEPYDAHWSGNWGDRMEYTYRAFTPEEEKLAKFWNREWTPPPEKLKSRDIKYLEKTVRFDDFAEKLFDIGLLVDDKSLGYSDSPEYTAKYTPEFDHLVSIVKNYGKKAALEDCDAIYDILENLKTRKHTLSMSFEDNEDLNFLRFDVDVKNKTVQPLWEYNWWYALANLGMFCPDKPKNINSNSLVDKMCEAVNKKLEGLRKSTGYKPLKMKYSAHYFSRI